MLVKRHSNNEKVTSDGWQTCLGKKCANADAETLMVTGHTVFLSSDLSDSDSEDNVDHDKNCRSLKRPVFVVEEPDEIEDHSEKHCRRLFFSRTASSREKWLNPHNCSPRMLNAPS